MIEHTISFRPAFDDMVNGCAHEPEGDHGRSSAQITFSTQQDHRGAELQVYSGWHLPETYKEGRNLSGDPIDWNKTIGMQTAQINIHGPEPVFKDQPISNTDCKITGGICYSDSAYSAANEVFETLVRSGEEPFWDALDEWIP